MDDNDDRWEVTEHKSLEEYVLEQIDTAAKTQELPAQQALDTANFVKWAAIFLAFYTGMVAIACTYSIWEVQQQNERQERYLEQACAGTNEDRKREKALWDRLFLESAKVSKELGEKVTNAERAALDRLAQATVDAYPQIDCSRVDDGERIIISPKGGPSG